MAVALDQPVACNMLLVQLIDQENLMDIFMDEHDWPNIDMTFVGIKGKFLELPAGLVPK